MHDLMHKCIILFMECNQELGKIVLTFRISQCAITQYEFITHASVVFVITCDDVYNIISLKMSYFVIFISNIFICVLFICGRNHAFKITECGSNMIYEDSSPDPIKNKKAKIHFDEDKKIDVSEGNPFTRDNIHLYCISDTLYEECTLTFQKKGDTANEIKCHKSVTPKCDAKNACENENVIRNTGTSNNCNFTLTKVTENGKYDVQSNQISVKH